MPVPVPSMILFPLLCAVLCAIRFIFRKISISRVTAVLFLCTACALLLIPAVPALAYSATAGTAEEVNSLFTDKNVDEMLGSYFWEQSKVI